MAQRTTETIQNEIICGQCTYPIPYLAKDEPPEVCPECGWEHLRESYKKYDVPSEFKLDLTKY